MKSKEIKSGRFYVANMSFDGERREVVILVISHFANGTCDCIACFNGKIDRGRCCGNASIHREILLAEVHPNLQACASAVSLAEVA